MLQLHPTCVGTRTLRSDSSLATTALRLLSTRFTFPLFSDGFDFHVPSVPRSVLSDAATDVSSARFARTIDPQVHGRSGPSGGAHSHRALACCHVVGPNQSYGPHGQDVCQLKMVEHDQERREPTLFTATLSEELIGDLVLSRPRSRTLGRCACAK
jgi:hypothetical protein